MDRAYVRPGNGAGNPSRWTPDYAGYDTKSRLAVGDLVAWRYAAWRVAEVTVQLSASNLPGLPFDRSTVKSENTPGGPAVTAPRRFNQAQRGALYLAADGHCQKCGVDLEPGWHADHMDPRVRGGPTDVINGQALCPRCNLQKGDSVDGLRPWQRQAIEDFYTARSSDFLVTATPGAGKTRFALALARRLLDERSVARLAVVVPTDALRQQWADEAAAFGIALMPVSEPEHYDKPGYQGCVVTYAQVTKGLGAEMLRRATRKATLAILDEIHHAGENRTWGDGLLYAVEQATYRLALTGTPWRRDPNSAIPFVRYDEYGRVVVDHAYEYGSAVADGVCRRIEFHAYDGDARWFDCGKISEASLGGAQVAEDVTAALEAAYHPAHQWMPALLARADEALTELRVEIPDAGGLVVAERQWYAVEYAKILARLTGTEPVVVVSDDPDALAAVQRFKAGRQRWLVAVRMVSEGVDIPRLAVGVYASKYRTPLFFRQIVGRFVRVRPGEEFNARLFIPAVQALMDHAREIEEELRHQLEKEAARAEAATRDATDRQGLLDLREPLSATEAEFDRAILGGEETSPDDLSVAQAKCREHGIPAHLALNVMRYAAAEGRAAPRAEAARVPLAVTPRHRQEKMLRQEVEALARKVAYRSGVNPKQVNTDLRKAGHPAATTATIAELEARQRALVKLLGNRT